MAGIEVTIPQSVAAAADFIRQRWPVVPSVAIVLGTGLGGLAEQIEVDASFPFEAIPHMPRATALGHAGRLVCGRLQGVTVAALQGRLHLYEGHSPQQVGFPIRVLRCLGAERLIVSNASGGLHPRFAAGSIMLIDDQLNLMWQNPLIGTDDEPTRSRFPDMSCPYDLDLQHRAVVAARKLRIELHRGIYAGFLGPNYETRAEYRFLRQIGADVVGMSTIPETIVAQHLGMRVLGLSVITNECRPDQLSPTSGLAVEQTAAKAQKNMSRLVGEVLLQLGDDSLS